MFLFRLKVAFDIPDDYEHFWGFFDIISEPTNRATTLTFRHTIKRIQEDFYSSEIPSLVLLEEDYKMIYAGIYFRAFSPFFETYNEMLGWMETFGFIELWRRRAEYNLQSKSEEIGPQVLTMDHLRVGFLACLIPLTISAFAFFVELFVGLLKHIGKEFERRKWAQIKRQKFIAQKARKNLAIKRKHRRRIPAVPKTTQRKRKLLKAKESYYFF